MQRHRLARRAFALACLAVTVAATVLVGSMAFGDDGPGPVAPTQSSRAAPSACTATATPHSLTEVFDAAGPGAVICLANGRYGTFVGGPKPGRVTLRAQHGARPSLSLDFEDAQHVELVGITISEARLAAATRDVTIRDSAFTGFLTIADLVDANVLLDHNTHSNIDTTSHSPPARIHLGYSSATPSGVTIQNSLLAGGDSDGIQTGVGVNIIANEFRDILENGPNHTDAIQLLGARGSIIRGNWIHNSSSGIVAYDGVAQARIENNVINLPHRPWGIELNSDDGSVLRHNTLPRGSCDYNLPCGIIDVSRRDDGPPGHGTVVIDNVASGISVQNGALLAARRNNLLGAEPASAGDLTGVPRFAGGAQPIRYEGYRLAGGSPGTRAASDGRDVGISR